MIHTEFVLSSHFVEANKLFDIVEYLQDRDFTNKNETIKAIKTAETVFNEIYSIKNKSHKAEKMLIDAMSKETLGEFSASRSEQWLERCRWARKHIEAMTQIVREQAKDVLLTTLDVT